MRDKEGLLLAFGKHLTGIIEKRGLSIPEVAKECGFSLPKTVKIFSGQVDVRLKSLITINLALGITYKQMFDFDYKKYV